MSQLCSIFSTFHRNQTVFEETGASPGTGWDWVWGRDGRADLFLCPEVRTERALGGPAAPHTPGAPVTLSDVPGAKTGWSRTAGSQQVTAKVRPRLIIVAVSQVLAHVVCSLNAGI